ncbi:MAG: protein translocase subunit SecF, partial [Candidatus Paceibacteria bacterium]
IGFGLLVMLAAGIAVGYYGLSLSIEFTGGSVSKVQFQEVERPNVTALQSTVSELKFVNRPEIRPIGDKEVSIRTKEITQDQYEQLVSKLRSAYSTDKVSEDQVLNKRGFSRVGPAISEELRQRAIIGLSIVAVAIIGFIALVFRKASYPVPSVFYGLSAILALVHDILIPVGVFAYLGHLGLTEIDVLFIVALLSILGLSVNDTIVVFDRVRENLRLYGTDQFERIVQMSLRQTLLRSINTSLTLLLVLVPIFLFGGQSVKYFALALTIGTVAGAYSSIFLASSTIVVLYRMLRRRRRGQVYQES